MFCAKKWPAGLLYGIILLSAQPVLGFDRIVSLSPQITASLFLLNGGRGLVGVSEFCSRPVEALTRQKVGTPLRPDVESIAGLRPDLVLASREGNPPWAVERLRRLGIAVRYLSRPRDMEALLGNFLELADIVGSRSRGEGIAEETRRRVGVAGEGSKKKVLWQVGADPLVVASKASFANDIIRLAGGENVIEAAVPYPRLNREEAVARRPGIIVLTNMGFDAARERERWQRLLPEARCIVMDAYVVGSPTPVTFADAVEELRGVIGRRDDAPLAAVVSPPPGGGTR